MKALLIIILFFSTLAAFGQIDSGFTDSTEAKNLSVNGIKTGKWVEYGYDEEFVAKGPTYYILVTYVNGKPEGVENMYYMHSNKTLMAKAVYKNGEKNGPERIYFPSRKIEVESNYLFGQLDGEYKGYSNLDGKLEMEAIYCRGRVVSKKVYYNNGSGKLKYEERYDTSGTLINRKDFYLDGSEKK